ncbi:GNAT family N-acetyltransferase [Longispora urticae]
MPTDDPLLRWATRPTARTFTYRDATAVAVPALLGRDRLVLAGPAERLAVLVPGVLADVGSGFRPIGDAATLTALCRDNARLRLVELVNWMHTTTPPRVVGAATWLDGGGNAVARLLDAAWPSSRARPGGPGVRRWAGARDRTGRLLAVAADAWSSEQVGFLAGLATHPDGRSRGFGRAVCSFVLHELVTGHGAAALVVNRSYVPAIRLFGSLGMSTRLLATARLL